MLDADVPVCPGRLEGKQKVSKMVVRRAKETLTDVGVEPTTFSALQYDI